MLPAFQMLPFFFVPKFNFQCFILFVASYNVVLRILLVQCMLSQGRYYVFVCAAQNTDFSTLLHVVFEPTQMEIF